MGQKLVIWVWKNNFIPLFKIDFSCQINILGWNFKILCYNSNLLHIIIIHIWELSARSNYCFLLFITHSYHNMIVYSSLKAGQAKSWGFLIGQVENQVHFGWGSILLEDFTMVGGQMASIKSWKGKVLIELLGWSKLIHGYLTITVFP